MVEKKNYYHNSKVELADDFVNGQAEGQVSKMRYGLYSMAWNGCEMIALYNAARVVGKKQDLARVCLEMYPKSSVCVGFFGSNPFKLYKYFDSHDIPYETVDNYNKFFNELKYSKCGVLSFWNHRRIFSSLHTVMVRWENGKIVEYNRSNSRTECVPLDHRSQITCEKFYITGYLLK